MRFRAIPTLGACVALCLGSLQLLSAQQCALCHADQASLWNTSRHANTQTDVAGELAQSHPGETPDSVVAGEDCIACHGPAGLGGMAPELQSKKGKDVPIWQRERILPLRSPFATTVWDYINRGMPAGNEGTLTANEVYSLTAYLLFLNKVIPEDEVLDKQSLPKVKMPIGDDYAKLHEWKPRTPRLEGYPY